MRSPRLMRRRVRTIIGRARYGYGIEDTFSASHHIARVIAGCAHELAQRDYSYPPNLTMEEWREKLAAIEEGFTAYADETLVFKRDTMEDPRFARAMALFATWFDHLWD